MKHHDKIDLLKIFGNAVAKKRRQLEMSQEKLAEITGLHRTYIGMLERGERNPTLVTIARFSKGLKLEAHELLKLSNF